jgi:hypothetical protein
LDEGSLTCAQFIPEFGRYPEFGLYPEFCLQTGGGPRPEASKRHTLFCSGAQTVQVIDAQ